MESRGWRRGEGARGVCRAALLAAGLVSLAATLATASPAADDRLLDEIERAGFALFRDEAHPATGLIPDAVRADASGRGDVANVAGSGFALAAFCVADERGWIAHTQAVARVRTMLRFLAEQAPHEHGFFYHFLDLSTGARTWESEASSIDTALVLCGALTARQQFDDPEIRRLAAGLYERVDWNWMRNGRPTLCLGWSPESGFSRYRWEGYAEHMGMYLLGIGSPTHPLLAESWKAWRREPVGVWAGLTFIECPPLFAHQYAHAFVDFRGLRDDVADYWRNSVFATLAQRQLCAEMAGEFKGFSTNLWGITSSQSAGGYKAWGIPPRTAYSNALDGTLAPSAAGGSIPFAPRECLDALRTMRQWDGGRLWRAYGFVNAFNPQTGWMADDALAIDTGITLVMAENYRSGLIWRLFMRNPEVREALTRAGFRPGAPAPLADATRDLLPLADGISNSVFNLTALQRFDAPRRAVARPAALPEEQWDWQTLDAASRESVFDGDGLVWMRFAFAWDATDLLFRAEVTDPDVRSELPAPLIYRQDSVILYVNPSHTALRWYGPDDRQFGFAVTNKTWEWFNRRLLDRAQTVPTPGGYSVSARIPWAALGVRPRPGMAIGVSPALHSVSHEDEPDMLLNWRWKKLDGDRVQLGTLTLE